MKMDGIYASLPKDVQLSSLCEFHGCPILRLDPGLSTGFGDVGPSHTISGLGSGSESKV